MAELFVKGHLQLTHHSDCGIQYCSHAYVKLLQDNNIKISMTKKGDPLENAVAERINGIVKEEYMILITSRMQRDYSSCCGPIQQGKASHEHQ